MLSFTSAFNRPSAPEPSPARSYPGVLPGRIRIALFCLVFFLPGPLGLIGITGWSGFVENRELAPFPWSILEAGKLDAATKGIDAFFSDHFALRPLLIYAANRAKLLMDAASTPVVLLYKKNWVFFQDSSNGAPAAQPAEAVLLGQHHWMFLNDLTDYRGLTVTDAAAIEAWKETYLQRQRWSEGNGAHFLLVISPQKASVYPEYLPDYAHALGSDTRHNQFLNAARGSGLHILDLTPALLEAKAVGQLYYKYDTHWNFRGAYFGARAIMNYLHSRFEHVPAFSDQEWTISNLSNQTQTFGDEGWYNLGVRLGVPFLKDSDAKIERRGGWTTQLSVTTTRRHMSVYTFTKDDPTLPSIVFYADSFGYPLKRMIAEHFRKAIFVNPFEDEKTLADEFPTEIIEQARPDYVIYLRWEHAAFAPADNPPELR
jgi:alginate O-acetyltransferase complex protein AlgJ